MSRKTVGAGATPGNLETDLEEMVSQVTFSATKPAYREGSGWQLYVHPRPSDEAGYFDALITVRPLDDRGDCQGHRLLVRHGERRTTWVAVTNGRGQAWFKRLPAGEFQPRLRARSSGPGTVSPLIRRSASDEWAPQSLAASDLVSPVADVEPELIHQPDARLVALLEATGADRWAVVTVQTQASELERRTVRCIVGTEVAEGTLEPNPGGGWSVCFRLRQTFDQAVANVPICTIVSLAE